MRNYYLSDMKQGQSAKLVNLPGRGRSGYRLSELGLRIGQKVTVKSIQPLRGPVIIRIGESEIAIGHSIANRINVEILD